MPSSQISPLAERDTAHLIHPVTEPRLLAAEGPRVVVAGDGWHVTDDRGHKIIDGFAGLWCVTVGHGRSEIRAAIDMQLQELDYFTTFHGQSHPRAIELAEKVASMFDPSFGLNHVMFSSGGSEANETNFKLVRLYWSLQGQPQRSTIISRHSGYHGLTIATMSATGILPMQWNFGPVAPGFDHIAAPYCFKCELGLEYPGCKLACAHELERAILAAGPETVAAFIAEPVIGAGGIIPPPPGYFQAVREICDRYGVLLIIDEVVTGFGRTGNMFGHETYGVRPDLVTLAKGITSGYLPLGASVVSGTIWDTIAERLPEQVPVSHGFTYSGHPVCCAAALANIEIIEREGLVANAADVGAYLQTQLRERLGGYETVGDIRGIGLMAGIELVADRETKRGFSKPHTACTRVENEAWDRGLYCRAMGIEVVGLAPPLTIDRACVDEMIDILAESIEVMESDVLAHEQARATRPRVRHASANAVFDAMDDRFRAPDDATTVDVCFALTGDGGGWWHVVVADAALTVRACDAEPDAAATIRASATDYVAIINGELSGADAFASQRIVVDGDLNQAIALSRLGLM
ncbi:MAG: aminotransferase class III-fold pyridoxal phosphate-dependent enzyme [Actinobacteria bacterium]|nr:aminotransferase class III-fold pyridoxal phosphate-dependent enzyme [Actinomycetota bacterium]